MSIRFFASPQHPYTEMLLKAVPRFDQPLPIDGPATAKPTADKSANKAKPRSPVLTIKDRAVHYQVDSGEQGFKSVPIPDPKSERKKQIKQQHKKQYWICKVVLIIYSCIFSKNAYIA
ncbi:MAG: hypothetical protein AAF446_02580 [Pseudomonadota bacterium]